MACARIVSANCILNTAPGVSTPARSSARPLGSVRLNIALIVPSPATEAELMVMTYPGRTIVSSAMVHCC
jgi:hypothetical protein